MSIGQKVGLAISALDVGCFYRVILVLRWVEIDRVVVHHLGLGEVRLAWLRYQVHLPVDDLLHYGHIGVIAVVGHGDHRGRGQTPPEAPCAHLGVELVEEMLRDRGWRENVRILGEDLFKFRPLLL